MDILLQRFRHTQWGIDGKLSIAGQQVGHTIEHPTMFLLPGRYPITLDKMILKRGNGPMLNTDGSICVGQLRLPGLVIKSRETFEPIYNRIQKSLKRGHEVSLIIEDIPQP